MGLLFLTACPSTKETSSRDPYRPQKELTTLDYIYESNIKTVQFYRQNGEGSYPVIYKGVGGTLTLEFDELIPLDQRETDFFVDLISCDANWNPTNVLPIEFYEGFSQDRIDLYTRSEFSKIPYVHYSYTFPQDGEGFKMSGNYLLKVYRGTNPDDLVITRRFVVVDRQVSISSKYVLSDQFERIEMREFSFDLRTGSLRVYNPANDLIIMMLQNFRWDNAFTFGVPRFTSDNSYEYQIDLNRAFTGGQEFRRHDVRSTRFYSESMEMVEEIDQGYIVYLFKDSPRLANMFSRRRRDLNGAFFVEVQEWPNADYQADYVYNFFTLKREEPYREGDVYLFGRFTDWQTRNAYKMGYNDELRQYEAEVLLKQGVYDYEYVIEKAGGQLDESSINGVRGDTENYYTVLVYYRAPADRTHQLVGFQPVNYRE